MSFLFVVYVPAREENPLEAEVSVVRLAASEDGSSRSATELPSDSKAENIDILEQDGDSAPGNDDDDDKSEKEKPTTDEAAGKSTEQQDGSNTAVSETDHVTDEVEMVDETTKLLDETDCQPEPRVFVAPESERRDPIDSTAITPDTTDPTTVKTDNTTEHETEESEDSKAASEITGEAESSTLQCDGEGNRLETEHRDGETGEPGREEKEDDETSGRSTDGLKEETEKSETENPGEEPAMDPSDESVLTPLATKWPLYQRVMEFLRKEAVPGICIDESLDDSDNTVRITFIEGNSQRCENLLNGLKTLGVGAIDGSSISIFPSSVYQCHQKLDTVSSVPSDMEQIISHSEETVKKESLFKKSIKSRLVVAQVVATVRSNAQFTFDYLLLILLASMIACLGLVENSSVVLVASMLISPLMGPILAGTFGQVIKLTELRNLGMRSELVGLSLCLVVGFVLGLVSGGIGLHGAVWGSTEEWPTNEMRSRGMLRSLWVGVLIALPSGAGVAISVLGGNASSLVGVAISASLLPPAVNAGMLWAYGLLAAISPPAVVMPDRVATTATTTAARILNVVTTSFTNVTLPGNITSPQENTTTTVPPYTATEPAQEIGSCFPLYKNNYVPVYSCNISHDAALLGLVSLLLTLLNISCILLMGILVLKIKEVAPHTAATASVDDFWQEDIKVARSYYQTSKGEESKDLGRQFLEEWKGIKKAGEGATEEEEEEEEPVQTLHFIKMMQAVENSNHVRHVISRLPPASATQNLSEGLSNEFTEATRRLNEKINKDPSVYLAEPRIHGTGKRLMDSAYHTIHGASAKPGIADLRSRFRKAESLFIDPGGLPSVDESVNSASPTKSGGFHLGLPGSSNNALVKKRKRKIRFQVTKVDDEEEEDLV